MKKKAPKYKIKPFVSQNKIYGIKTVLIDSDSIELQYKTKIVEEGMRDSIEPASNSFKNIPHQYTR
jgi:hypothetical protein